MTILADKHVRQIFITLARNNLLDQLYRNTIMNYKRLKYKLCLLFSQRVWTTVEICHASLILKQIVRPVCSFWMQGTPSWAHLVNSCMNHSVHPSWCGRQISGISPSSASQPDLCCAPRFLRRLRIHNLLFAFRNHIQGVGCPLHVSPEYQAQWPDLIHHLEFMIINNNLWHEINC